MSETPQNSYESRTDATEMGPETAVDFHAGNPNLSSLDKARNARMMAEKAFEASEVSQEVTDHKAIDGYTAYIYAIRQQTAA